MTDEFGPGCGRRKPGDFPASLAPDMLDNLECFNLEAKTARPVWLTISVPSDALAGNYRGKVTIYAKGKRKDVYKRQDIRCCRVDSSGTGSTRVW